MFTLQEQLEQTAVEAIEQTLKLTVAGNAQSLIVKSIQDSPTLQALATRVVQVALARTLERLEK